MESKENKNKVEDAIKVLSEHFGKPSHLIKDFLKAKSYFYLDSDEQKKLDNWKEAIKEVFNEYGNYEYRFSSGGGIGQVITVHSSVANKELDLTDVSKW